jgi:hypothetical protein
MLVQPPVERSVRLELCCLCTKREKVGRTGAAETNAPRKKRKKGVYDKRRIVLGGLDTGYEMRAGLGEPELYTDRYLFGVHIRIRIGNL